MKIRKFADKADIVVMTQEDGTLTNLNPEDLYAQGLLEKYYQYILWQIMESDRSWGLAWWRPATWNVNVETSWFGRNVEITTSKRNV